MAHLGLNTRVMSGRIMVFPHFLKLGAESFKVGAAQVGFHGMEDINGEKPFESFDGRPPFGVFPGSVGFLTEKNGIRRVRPMVTAEDAPVIA